MKRYGKLIEKAEKVRVFTYLQLLYILFHEAIFLNRKVWIEIEFSQTNIKAGWSIAFGFATLILVLFMFFALAFWYGSRLVVNHTDSMDSGKVLTTVLSMVSASFALMSVSCSSSCRSSNSDTNLILLTFLTGTSHGCFFWHWQSCSV